MAIISVEPVGIPLISSVLCEPKKNYKIGLTVYQKQKKEAERQGRSYQYATETDEIYFDISTFQILMQKTMTCPSNNMRINKNNAKSAV